MCGDRDSHIHLVVTAHSLPEPSTHCRQALLNAADKGVNVPIPGGLSGTEQHQRVIFKYVQPVPDIVSFSG